MMLKILKDRFIRLGRDEDGVALVITLGVFMFLYVACASVYAVGMAVKEKMHLQGACDAAAYSAAIVQADTFSRIATINRAMSWTYQQMTRRQMDYIVWQWLLETAKHYGDDENAAAGFVQTGPGCPNQAILRSRGIGWDIGSLNDGQWRRNFITLNDRHLWTKNDLDGLCGKGIGSFGNHLLNSHESFYSQRGDLHGDGSKRCGLARQINDDLRNIRDMSSTVEILAKSLPDHVKYAVEGVLAANIPSYMHGGDCQYFIEQNQKPLDYYYGYFQPFPNTRGNELVFLSLGNEIYNDPEEAFETGANSWFNRDDEKANQWGFHRHYLRNRTISPLVSNWNWWAIRWRCMWDPIRKHYDVRVAVATPRNCNHPGHDRCRCSVGENRLLRSSYWRGSSSYSMESTVRSTCYANNSGQYGYDNRFEGRIDGQIVRARPLKLKSNYFGKAGTITVGLARRNENPWFSIFGRVTGGMYSAFSPVADSWTFCFASAKAGYKLYHEPNDWYINAHLGSRRRTRKLDDWEEKLNGNVRAENGPRDYCIDWKKEESKFAGWYWEYKRDERGRYVRDENGRRIRETLVTQWTAPSELNPSWRQSWNLVQDDWDAVMVPVRQGGSSALEIDRWREDHQQDWNDYWMGWMRSLWRGGWRTANDQAPLRYEPVWQPGGAGNIASMINNANWQRISGRGGSVPNTSVTAGPTYGDRGDPLGGRLAGQIWDDHWRRGMPPPTATGTSQWNIENAGAGLDWNQIENEMYH